MKTRSFGGANPAEGANHLYVDAHVEWVDAAEMDSAPSTFSGIIWARWPALDPQ